MNGRGGYDIRRRRRREIESIAQYVGAAQTDDYSRYLVLWAQALPERADRMFRLLRAASQRMGRRISEAEAREIVEEARCTSRPRTPDGWARALGLKYERRQFIGITTIGAIDVNKRERARLRKLRRRQREEGHRRALGARSQLESLSRTKPWKAEGMSRRTWYRRRKRPVRALETGIVAQVRGQHSYSCRHEVVPTFVRESLKRGAQTPVELGLELEGQHGVRQWVSRLTPVPVPCCARTDAKGCWDDLPARGCAPLGGNARNGTPSACHTVSRNDSAARAPGIAAAPGEWIMREQKSPGHRGPGQFQRNVA